MKYLDQDRLEGLSAGEFQGQQPYPWVNIEDSLTAQGFEELRRTLPDVSLFERKVGVKRAHGQGYHDRYLLHYHPGLPLSAAWREFIAELHGRHYETFLRRMLGLGERKSIVLTLEWYFAWQGCGVSPHCDARRKTATHIFYFNTNEDWDPNWGGDILMLDDNGRFQRHSAPKFEDLKVGAALVPRGNGSLLFQRTEHSWHGVRPLESPPDRLRKLFIVTVNEQTIQVLYRRLRGKDPDGYPLVRHEGLGIEVGQ
ncbi:MAG: 2OG-Fe(II) oxygenase [Thermoguttaceae bacterium]|jgi:hypothetical protein